MMHVDTRQLLAEDVARTELREWNRWGVQHADREELRSQVIELALDRVSDSSFSTKLSDASSRIAWVRAALRFKTLELMRERRKRLAKALDAVCAVGLTSAAPEYE